jgi:Kelch motif
MNRNLFQISASRQFARIETELHINDEQARKRCAWIGIWSLIVLCFAAIPTQAQLTPYVWQQQMNLATSPPPAGDGFVVGALMAYDSFRDETVLSPLPSDTPQVTWLWNGASWSSSPVLAPTNMTYASAMVYDNARHVMVLYCFVNEDLRPGQTWEWNGSAWSLITTNSPPSVFGCAMAYDARRQRTVLFGGSPVPDFAGDVPPYTYEYDGDRWYLVATNGPPRRNEAAAVYDPVHGVTVLFGGTSHGSSSDLGDTWTWNGTNWTELAVTGPAARSSHSMTYDAYRQRVLLFGGLTGYYDSAGTADLWEWDGVQWSLSVSNGPPGRYLAGLTYDSSRQQTILFSGLTIGGTKVMYDDTWVLAQRQIWVKYGYTGAETGDFATPFSLLAHATTVAPANVVINIMPGAGTEQLTVSKPLTLRAPLGPATIGGP